MSAGHTLVCPACGSDITPDVPEYFIELECFRLIQRRGAKAPRRGSAEYHEAIEKLSPEIRETYFKNREMYDEGHLWCPKCGCRLKGSEGIGET